MTVWATNFLWIGGEQVSGVQFQWVGLTNGLISSAEADWDAGQPNGNENAIAIHSNGWHDAGKHLEFYALCEGR